MKMCRALCSIAALTLLAISQQFAKAQALSNAIAQASENLLIIKTEKLKWPPVEMK